MAGQVSDILRQKWKVAIKNKNYYIWAESVRRGAHTFRQVWGAGEWAAAAIALSVVFISGGCHGKSMLALFRILPQASLASFRTSNTQRALSRHYLCSVQRRTRCETWAGWVPTEFFQIRASKIIHVTSFLIRKRSSRAQFNFVPPFKFSHRQSINHFGRVFVAC